MTYVSWGEQQGQIEKGIPLLRTGRPPKYPWHQMEVGDSFLVRCLKEDRYHVRNSLNSCARGARKATGWAFVIRMAIDGVRVWRIS